jgi:hypothetical protein
MMIVTVYLLNVDLFMSGAYEVKIVLTETA